MYTIKTILQQQVNAEYGQVVKIKDYKLKGIYRSTIDLITKAHYQVIDERNEIHIIIVELDK